MHDADAEGAVFRGHAVDGDDLARHLANGRAARRERGAGMTRFARRFQIEPCDRVTTALLGRPGSGTSTYLLRAASASMMSRVEGVPTSSSGVNSTVIGSGVVKEARANCRMASSVR